VARWPLTNASQTGRPNFKAAVTPPFAYYEFRKPRGALQSILRRRQGVTRGTGRSKNHRRNMASNEDIGRMQTAIAALHGCGSRHVMPVAVHEVSEGPTAWRVVVEVFDLIGHAEAVRCYAWIHAKGRMERFVIVLEIPPVVTPQTAVQAFLMRQAKKAGKRGARVPTGARRARGLGAELPRSGNRGCALSGGGTSR
jgi:hypothetical protein